MLTPFFDLQLAQYDSLSQVNKDELALADLVIIRGYLPQGVYYSQKMIWRLPLRGLSTVQEVVRSKRERETLTASYEFFVKHDYSVKVELLTEASYQEFVELYKHTTLERPRAMSYDLEEQVLGKLKVEIPVYLVRIDNADGLQAGLLFSIQGKGEGREAKVSFSAKKKFSGVRSGAGGVLLAELIKFCLQENVQEISGGRGVNPIGLTAKAGLFEFKARYGFSAFPDGAWQTMFILNEHSALSELVFVSAVEDQVGYILLTNDIKPKAEKRFLTREVKKVRIQSLPEFVEQSRAFFKTL